MGCKVVELTDGVGVDRVVEVGGPGTLQKSIAAVRVGGIIGLIGILTGVDGEISPTSIMRKSITLRGIYVGSRQMFLEMNEAVSQHGMKPVIDETFEFTGARATYHRMRRRPAFRQIGHGWIRALSAKTKSLCPHVIQVPREILPALMSGR